MRFSNTPISSQDARALAIGGFMQKTLKKITSEIIQFMIVVFIVGGIFDYLGIDDVFIGKTFSEYFRESGDHKSLLPVPEVDLPPHINLKDFILDKNELSGNLSLRGLIVCVNDSCTLFDNSENVSISIDASKIPRDDRRKFFDCNLYDKKCDVIMGGTLIKDNFSLKSFAADDVFWVSSP